MDAIFFLKAGVPKGLPANVKGVALDPVEYGFACGGADKHCSTAYSQLWSALGGPQGRVIPTLRNKYGVDGRVAFVSFSAGHGFMNPLLARESPDAVVLLDSTFGGGKAGYVRAAQSAAAGGPLLLTATSDKGTTDALSNGDYAWREAVLKPAGLLSMPTTPVLAPMPAPGEGAFGQGNLFYYRYTDAELTHTSMGKLLTPSIQAYLLPYWAGTLGKRSLPKWAWVLAGVAAFGALYFMSRTLLPKPPEREEAA